MAKNPKIREQAQRLRAARKARGFKTAAAAIARFGWKQSTYLAHENGQNGISAEAALEYAKAYDLDPGWLLTSHGRGLDDEAPDYEGPSLTPTNGSIEVLDIDGHGIVRLPIRENDSSITREITGDFVPVPLGLLQTVTEAPPEMIAVLRVTDDSMYPTLKSGDLAFVDLRQNRLARDGIYALRFNGGTVMKRAQLHLETRHITLSSDNPKFKSQLVRQPERLLVIGQVFWSLTRH